MKILSNQAAKATRMASNSLPKDFPNDLLLSSGGILHENSSCRDRHFAIATESLKFGCGIRQDEEIRKRFLNCFENRKITLSDALNIDNQQLPSLYHLLQSGVHDFNADGLVTPSTRLQDIRTMPTAQTREYRKSITLKWGSLNLSLDLVMVVKSKSSSKSNPRSNLKACNDGVNFIPEERHLLKPQHNTNDLLST